MKLRSLDEIRQSAAVYPSVEAATMTRQQRLERWAELLEKHPGPVQMLHSTEFVAEPHRRTMRQDDSPIAVAFADPGLRLQGLAGDTYEDARQFFDLTNSEAHLLLCDCHAGASVSGRIAAMRVRQIGTATAAERSLLFVGLLAASAVAAGALLTVF
jgi:hypothetical protein